MGAMRLQKGLNTPRFFFMSPMEGLGFPDDSDSKESVPGGLQCLGMQKVSTTEPPTHT